MATSAAARPQNLIEETLHQLGLSDVNAGVCGVQWMDSKGEKLVSHNPSTGQPIATITCGTGKDYDAVVSQAQTTFEKWRMVPAPQRGEIIREIGNELRKYKEPLGRLISIEVGKIYSEGLGEVQEAIDICDFAVGLSRQLYGLAMHSERPGHRMYEQWHPLGPIGIITAFNFPCAVWAWNAAIAAVCGDTMVWKPSEKSSLIAIALTKIAHNVLDRHGYGGVMNLIVGHDKTFGEKMANDERLPLVSATGSVPMGRSVGQAVAKRLGRSLLELGGNNAIIVMDDADMELTTRAIAFGAVGTAGQRCTSTRRLFVHESIVDELTKNLEKAYTSISIGNPVENEKVLMGPLVDEGAVEAMMSALDKAKEQGARIVCGGKRIEGDGHFVTPAIVRAGEQIPVMVEETFAPILYIVPIKSVEDAIQLQNDVPQGLSSAIFTLNVKNSEKFLSHAGSDCGIANVNIGTSGAEIGGAFGGEKETGGGRESGSDAWKAYMRRQTCTINWSDELPLAQGVEFL